MNYWMTLAVDTTVACSLIVFVGLIYRPVRWRYLFIAITIITVDMFLTVGIALLGQPVTLALRLNWNWLGKCASLAFSVVMLSTLPGLRNEIGLSFKQRDRSHRWSLILTFVAIMLTVAWTWTTSPTPFNAETLLFQLTMPTLSEELIYRGILFAVLRRAWPDTNAVALFPAKWAAAISTIIFGVGHAFTWTDGLHINVESMIYATTIGTLLMLIRLRSGSLLYCMAAHSMVNLIANGIPMVR